MSCFRQTDRSMNGAEDVNGGQSFRRLTSIAMSGGVKIKEMVDEEEVEKLSAQKKSQVIHGECAVRVIVMYEVRDNSQVCSENKSQSSLPFTSMLL